MQQFVDENLKVSNPQYNEHDIADSNKYYDTYICGSDQIWNPDLVPTDSMYWLPFVEKGKIKLRMRLVLEPVLSQKSKKSKSKQI